MIYAISDIHGCYSDLAKLIAGLDIDDNRIVFLGDYIDYGPDSLKVLLTIFEIQKQHGRDKISLIKTSL